MARAIPPSFVDDRKLTAAEQRCLDGLLPPEEQTGDTRRDLVEASHVMAHRLRQHELDILNAGGVLNALYRDMRSWRRMQGVTWIPFTTARYWAVRWRTVEETDDPAVDTAV